MLKKLPKILVFLCAMLFIVGFVGSANAVPYTTTLSFEGHAAYDSFTDDVTGAVGYEFNWDLPAWNQECEWYIDVDVWYFGAYGTNGDDPVHFGDDLVITNHYIGTFPLIEYETEIQAVKDYIEGLPNPYLDENIGYSLIGDWESGNIVFSLFDVELECIDYGAVWFGGDLSLNANPIPEPATMLLLGSGFIGLAFLGRKKLFKKS